MAAKLNLKDKPFNLVRWFSVLSSLSIVTITIITAILLSRFLSRNMLLRDAIVTMEFVQSIAHSENTTSYFETKHIGKTSKVFEDFFEKIATMPEVSRANVYSGDGTVIWSDDPSLIGHKFMPNPELELAISGTLSVSSGRKSKPNKAEHVLDQDVPYFAEIYIPIWGPEKEKVVGAVEVYKVPLTLLNAIEEGTRLVWVSSVIGSFFLYAVLFWIIERASRTILQQQKDQIQSEKLVGIGVMAAGIAHEVNNPLAAMLGKAEMIIEEKDPARIDKYARDIIKFAKKASKIVKEITLYSRPPATPRTLNKISINDQIEKAIKLSGYTNPFTHIELVKDFRLLPPVRGNTVEIEQVFVNLINNAVQAMDGRGRLFVKSRSEGGAVVVTIQDTGTGMKEEHLKQLFTPFFTTKDPGKGTGLGLNIVHKIITNHGGSIHVESEEGQGTTFIVELPSADDAVAQGGNGRGKNGKSLKERIESWKSRPRSDAHKSVYL
ncbi:MAG: sensor histidine kinase [Nitrospiria bacterium]